MKKSNVVFAISMFILFLINLPVTAQAKISKPIDFHITNLTALFIRILDKVPTSTPYQDSFLCPCEINYLKIYIYMK